MDAQYAAGVTRRSEQPLAAKDVRCQTSCCCRGPGSSSLRGPIGVQFFLISRLTPQFASVGPQSPIGFLQGMISRRQLRSGRPIGMSMPTSAPETLFRSVSRSGAINVLNSPLRSTIASQPALHPSTPAISCCMSVVSLTRARITRSLKSNARKLGISKTPGCNRINRG